MTQRRWSEGIFLILMLEAVRRKSNCAVTFFSSDRVVGEMGIVVICLFTVWEGRKSGWIEGFVVLV